MAGGYIGGEYWTFAQLCAAVYTETNRPDLVAETQQAVYATIQQLHTWQGEFFFKDIVTGQGTFASNGTNQAAYVWQLDTNIFPRYRSLAYLRKWDPSWAAYELNPTNLPPLQGLAGTGFGASNQQRALRNFKVLSPTNLMDSYWTEKVDVCYQAGSSLNIKSSTPLAQFQIGYYEYPNVDIQNGGVNLSSWVVREYPWAVVYLAAATLFGKIGNAESSSIYFTRGPDGSINGLAADHIRSMINSNIIATGE